MDSWEAVCWGGQRCWLGRGATLNINVIESFSDLDYRYILRGTIAKSSFHTFAVFPYTAS